MEKDFYDLALKDAVVSEIGEIEPLVAITKDSNMVTWNRQKDKVLLLSWHQNPKLYVEGTNIVLAHSEVWAFTDKEIIKWYKENSKGVADWNLRLRQLIGLPPDAYYTHMTGFWVSPKDVYRPAYCTDIEEIKMDNQFDEKCKMGEAKAIEYKKWFHSRLADYYYKESCPWTRLGYTYDWGKAGDKYGLTEFLIAKSARVKIAFTKTTKEFISTLQKNPLRKSLGDEENASN